MPVFARVLLAERRYQLVQVVFGIAKVHVSGLHVERGVVDAGVARGHRPLHEEHVLGLPRSY